MATKAELVKELRARTNAGMKDCINALNASNDDIEAAIKWLRENGTIKAAKKQSAIAAEGVVLAKAEGKKAAIVEVNCQTDFVATNDQFVALANDMLKEVMAQAKTSEEIDQVLVNGKNIKEVGVDLTATIGEKIAYRRGVVYSASASQSVGAYTHMNKKYAVIALFDGSLDETEAKQVCMHICVNNPKYINRDSVDQNWLAEEKKLLVEQTIKEGKPAEFAEKIVAGRLNKELEEICLENQKYLINPDQTVGAFLASKNCKCVAFTRFELGEGIEKKESDFAAEVAAQMK